MERAANMSEVKDDFKSMPMPELQAKMETSSDGLSEAEAKKRLTQVDQSALTGESLPATRKPGEAVFSGSIIRQGEIGTLVYATGANTYFGKTAQLVSEAHTVSHFQKAVLQIGNYLILLAVVLVTAIIAVAIYRGDPILTTLQFALVLTVAAIPVAMPTVLSVRIKIAYPRSLCACIDRVEPNDCKIGVKNIERRYNHGRLKYNRNLCEYGK
jgi:hypothetical protein